MGRVFKALDLRRQEARDRHPHVAVKLLTQSFRQHPASFVALQREARRAQTLAHPNIISVFDFDREGSLVYLIMEYLCGHTLNDILLQPGFSGLGFQNAMQILGPVGEALTFAHDHGIVHSDLKPSNIFLTDDGRVKVIDFGIARAFRLPDAADGDATLFDASSLRAFSPLYASPELIDGDEADPRDDVFSLACIAYELISGKHPFGRRSAAIARSISHEPQKLVNLSRPQWGALRKGLSFSRAERTASVEGFLTGLNPRPRGKNRRTGGKNARLPAAGRTAAAGHFFARLDPRPAAKHLRRQTAETAANLGRVVVRLKPLLAGKNLRLSAATIALALAVVTGLWLAQPGRMTTPDNLIGDDAWKEPVTPAVQGPDGEPAPPGGMVPAPGATTDPATARNVAAIGSEDRSPPTSPFRDCDGCPEMIVIPAGRFEMGAPATDTDAEPEEQPRREVAIDKAFALGRYEVTEREWDACAKDGVCRNVPAMSGTILSDTPKTHANWQDAQAFIRWLNEKTGRSYRLPTEAEWEYAARAGTDTRYPWGDQIGENNANCRDCGAPMGGRLTVPVGSFAPNGFGLFDMVGNVWEWTADCGGASGQEPGRDATPACERRVLRGGSWANSAAAVRVTQRLSANATIREDIVGFRVARDLP